MTDRDRLIELLLQSDPIKERDLDDEWFDGETEDIADYLLANGVILPPCKVVYYIVDYIGVKGTKQAFVAGKHIDFLSVYELKDLKKYNYYPTKKEAEKALAERSGDNGN